MYDDIQFNKNIRYILTNKKLKSFLILFFDFIHFQK